MFFGVRGIGACHRIDETGSEGWREPLPRMSCIRRQASDPRWIRESRVSGTGPDQRPRAAVATSTIRSPNCAPRRRTPSEWREKVKYRIGVEYMSVAASLTAVGAHGLTLVGAARLTRVGAGSLTRVGAHGLTFVGAAGLTRVG